MNIALVKYTSIDIEMKFKFIIPFSDELNRFFDEKNYGAGIKEIIIGIICVSEKFDQFFKPRKPRYIKDKKIFKSRDTKQEYEIEKCLEYDIKIDFETFKNVNEVECKRLLANEILQSLKVLYDMKGKIKDFNTEQFKADLEDYFKEKELI